jgi:RNA polymerase sigma-32 factor
MTNMALTNLPVVANGSMDAYISYVNSLPLLTEQEEQDYARRWRDHEDV